MLLVLRVYISAMLMILKSVIMQVVRKVVRKVVRMIQERPLTPFSNL